MIFQKNKIRLSYIGPSIEINEKTIINSYTDFLDVLYNNIIFNNNIDIRITTINICDFSYSNNFIDNIIDLIDEKTNILINSILDEITKNKLRIFLYIPKDYYLGSKTKNVKEYTIKLLTKLSEILDLINVNCPSICIRIGSAYGNRKSTMEYFVNTIKDLDRNIVNKLCIMNDEKPSLFSVTDLLVGVYYPVNIPICFRILSHQFNTGGLSIKQALFLSYSTWESDDIPIIIYGESKEIDEYGMPLTLERSDFIKHIVPTFDINVDVVFDSKMKEDSCLKYIMEYKKLKTIIINKKIK